MHADHIRKWNVKIPISIYAENLFHTPRQTDFQKKKIIPPELHTSK